jgi:Tfp pilus assembly protein PilO
VKLESMNLSALKRPIVLITVGSVVLLAALWWLLWMSPEGSKLNTVLAEKSSLTTTLAGLNQTLAADKAQAPKVSQYAGYLSMFASDVPPLPEAPQLTTELANLANTTNVHLITLSDDTTVPGTPLGTIPLTMSIEGPRQNVIAFLQGIYNPKLISRLITITGFTPTPAAGNQVNVLKRSNAPYTAAITGAAYYDPEIDPGSATSTTATTTTATG